MFSNSKDETFKVSVIIGKQIWVKVHNKIIGIGPILDKNPYEFLMKRKPKFSYLRVLGLSVLC